VEISTRREYSDSVLNRVDERRLFQRLDRKIAEVLLQDLDSSSRGVEAANPRRP
jgi:hypothetical protein